MAGIFEPTIKRNLSNGLGSEPEFIGGGEEAGFIDQFRGSFFKPAPRFARDVFVSTPGGFDQTGHAFAINFRLLDAQAGGLEPLGRFRLDADEGTGPQEAVPGIDEEAFEKKLVVRGAGQLAGFALELGEIVRRQGDVRGQVALGIIKPVHDVTEMSAEPVPDGGGNGKHGDGEILTTEGAQAVKIRGTKEDERPTAHALLIIIDPVHSFPRADPENLRKIVPMVVRQVTAA